MAQGVKETKELLSGILVVVKVVAQELKDGFQVADLIAAFNAIQGDAVKKAKLEEALKNIQDVPAEFKDATLSEWLEIAVHVIGELPDLLSAFKKEA
jgi:uncharacterized protein (DUF433 family)